MNLLGWNKCTALGALVFALLVGMPGGLLGAPGPIDDDPKKPAKKKTEAAPVRYFSINPGLMIQASELGINSPFGPADMRASNGFVGKWMLDFKSRDFKWTERLGLHLIVHTSPLDYDSQEVTESDTGGGGSGGGGGGEGRIRLDSGLPKNNIAAAIMDVGTRMQGQWTYAVPAAYYRFGKGPHGWRVGLGFGFGRVSMHGNFSPDSASLGLLAIRMFDSPRDEVLNGISAAYFGSGIVRPGSGDPVFTALMADLKTGNNLEALGLYMLAKGWRPSEDNLLLGLGFLASATNQGQTGKPLEALAISVLTQGFTSFDERVPVWRAFLEVPIVGNVVGYVNLGYSRFRVGGLRYELIALDLAITYRLAI